MPSHTEHPSLSSQRIPAITTWLQVVAQPGTNGTTGQRATLEIAQKQPFFTVQICVCFSFEKLKTSTTANSFLTVNNACLLFPQQWEPGHTHRQTYAHTCSAEVRAQRVVHLKSIVYMVLLLGLYADATVRLIRPVPSAICSRETRLGPRRRHWVRRE